MDLTDMRVEVEQTVPAPAEAVWDLLADVTRIGDWSPECVRAEWLAGSDAPRPGARFRGHNLMDGREWSVTCVVVRAERPRAFAWVVLDEAADPDRPSSHWRYDLEPVDDGTTRVSHVFAHGAGGSGVTLAVAKYPDKAQKIIDRRAAGLRANMLRALERVSVELQGGPQDPRG